MKLSKKTVETADKKLSNIISKLIKSKHKFSINTPPPNITLKLLQDAMDCMDLRAINNPSLEYLWYIYYIKMLKFIVYY